MFVFGRYEAVEELSRNPFGSVYKGRPMGDKGDANLIIKTFNPLGLEEEKLLVDPAAGEFLERAAVQKKAAEAGQHVAAILDSGTAPTAAYYVSKLYPSSVARLVRGQVRLDALDLHAVVWAIYQGLLQIESACKQPHGNLDITTVLLGKRTATGYAEIALAEPLTPQLANKTGTVGDVRALAQIVYQMVTFKTLQASGGYPAQMGPEWQRLKKGKAWLEFVNKLLDPSVGGETLTLEVVGQELKRLRVSGGLPTWAKVAAVLVVVGAASAGGYIKYERDKRAKFPQEWREYVTAHKAWFDGLWGQRNDLRAGDPTIDKDVIALLKQFEDSRPEGVATLDAASPPDVGLQSKVRKYLEAIHRLPPALAAWKGPVDLKATRGRIDRSQWPLPLELDQALVRVGQPLGGNPEELRNAINTIILANQKSGVLEEALRPLDAQVDLFSKQKDQILGQFKSYAQKTLKSAMDAAQAKVEEKDLDLVTDAKLAALIKAAGELQAQGKGAYGVLTGGDEVDFPEMQAQEAEIYKLPLPQALAQWAAKAPEHLMIKVPDVRLNWDFETRLAAVDRRLASLKEKIAADQIYAKDLDVEALEKASGTLRSQYDEAKKYKWNKANQTRVETLKSTVDAALKAFESQSVPDDAKIADLVRRHDEMVLAQIEAYRKESFAASTPLAELFAKHRDSQLKRATDAKKLGTVPADFDAMKKALAGLDADFPGAIDLPRDGGWHAQAASAIDGMAAKKREELMRAALGRLAFSPVDVPAPDSQFTTAWDQGKKELADFAKSAQAFVAAFDTIERQLDRTYAPGEDFDGKGTTIDALAKAHAAFAAAPELGPALRGITGKIAEVKAIAAQTDVKQLRDAAAKGQTRAAQWAAWRGLMTQKWPAGIQDLGAATQLRSAMLELTRAAGADRASALETDGQQIADRLLSGPATQEAAAAAVSAVLGSASKLGLGRDGELPDFQRVRLSDPARFNCVVYVLKERLKSFSGETPEKGAKEQIASIVELLEQATPGAGKLAVKDELAEGLAALMKEKDEQDATAGDAAGPTKAPVAALQSKPIESTKESVTFMIGQEKVRFLLVKGNATGGKRVQCYMSATEVPIGLVMEVLERANLTARNAGLSISGTALGPVAWRLRGSSIDTQDKWLIGQNAGGRPFYTAASVGPRCGESPTQRHPMQFVSPESAMYIASLLGCRLPTTAEWRAALPQQRNLPNLREGAWLVQRNHAINLGMEVTLTPWPDNGVFIPDRANPATGSDQKIQVWTTASLTPGLTRLGATSIQVPASYDDQAAFFTPVPDGQAGIADLIGNVAEIVWDAPELVEKTKNKTLPAMADLVNRNDKAMVVGGSALSAPEIGLDAQPWAPPTADEKIKGWTDVGFRLAFPAVKPKIAQRLKDLFEDQRFAAAR